MSRGKLEVELKTVVVETFALDRVHRDSPNLEAARPAEKIEENAIQTMRRRAWLPGE